MLPQHLRRLSASAAHFDYPCDLDRVTKELAAHSARFVGGGKYKVRVTLDRHGDVSVESWLLDEPREAGPARVALSSVITDLRDRFLYHKTTRRRLYDELYRVAQGKGFVDVLFLNEHGQVTEGAISNVFIRKGEILITPPVTCGLLNGVYRQHLLETHPQAREGVVSPDDLRDADGIYISNAVQGLRQVTLCEQHLGLDGRTEAERLQEPSAHGIGVTGPGGG